MKGVHYQVLYRHTDQKSHRWPPLSVVRTPGGIHALHSASSNVLLPLQIHAPKPKVQKRQVI